MYYMGTGQGKVILRVEDRGKRVGKWEVIASMCCAIGGTKDFENQRMPLDQLSKDLKERLILKPGCCAGVKGAVRCD